MLEGERVTDVEKLAAQIEAVRRVAQDLMSYNPSHGDFLTAGRMVMEALEGDDHA